MQDACFNGAAVHHGGEGRHRSVSFLRGPTSTEPPFITAERVDHLFSPDELDAIFNGAAVHHGGEGGAGRSYRVPRCALQRSRRSSRRRGSLLACRSPRPAPRFNGAAVHHGGEGHIEGPKQYRGGAARVASGPQREHAAPCARANRVLAPRSQPIELSKNERTASGPRTRHATSPLAHQKWPRAHVEVGDGTPLARATCEGRHERPQMRDHTHERPGLT